MSNLWGAVQNDGHYFCGTGGNRPDGLNEPVTKNQKQQLKESHSRLASKT
ncbi:copper resistance protein [Escherichia coli]|nr:copper resistance protein [Escherichia coli]